MTNREKEKYMIFTKIGIENYRAIDHLEYEPQNRIACLSGSNGRGKSSFFSALYTGLTGNIDKTNVQNGKEYAEIQIETLDRDQNMVSILRKIPRQKPNQLKINGKTTKIADGNQFISSIMNMPISDFQIVTSSDVMTHLKPREFSDFLVKYIPEKLNLDQLLKFDPTLVEAEKNLLRAQVKDQNEITIPDIKNIYKQFRDLDLSTKREIERLEALIQTYMQEHHGATTRTQEVIQADLSKTSNLEAQYIAAEKRKKTNQQLLQIIQSLQTELQGKKLVELKYKSQDIYHYVQQLYNYKRPMESQLRINDNTIQKMNQYIASMQKSQCPLHQDIVCQTDKSAVIREMQNTIQSLQQNNLEIKANIKKATKTITDYEAYYQKLLEAEKYNQELALKQNQLEEHKKVYQASVQETNGPKISKNYDFKAKKDALMMEFQERLKYEQHLQSQNNLKKQKELHEYYQKLIKFLAMDGIAIEKITEYYLNLFNQTIAARIQLLNIDLNIQFVLDDGISYRVYKQGTNECLEYEQLSTGEKKIIAFLILDLLNILSGARLMFLDDLNDLDVQTFEHFIQMITNPEFQKYYDHIFIGTVLNSDFRNVLSNYQNCIDFIY